ncbi:CehA/McbA family metallohydrolase [candidate division KSB1 bacterium]
MSSPCPSNGKWFKGSIHGHSLFSDGDASPEQIADVYRELDYDFVILTEHNRLTPADRLPVYDNGDFLMFAGEEVTAEADGLPVHVNAYGLNRTVTPVNHDSVQDTLQANIDLVLDAGGVPQVNHPNFRWAFTHRQLHNVSGYNLMEIFNGHADVANGGDSSHPSHEFIWDQLLTYGRKIFGVAADDAHHYLGSARRHPPGRGWINLRIDKLSVDSVVEGIHRGMFYSSTGPSLEELSCSNGTLRVKVADYTPGTLCLYIGAGGRLLYYSDEASSEFSLPGDEPYVRARIDDTRGRSAWTQPLWNSR